MNTQTFRITTLPNSYINWVEKTKFGFSKSYSYDIYIRGEKIESADKCDARHYNRIKATAQLMCLGSYRQMFQSMLDRLYSENFLKYVSIFKNTFLAENRGGEERSNLNLKFQSASWNEGAIDYKGNNILVQSITLRAEPIHTLNRTAMLEYEYKLPGRVGLFRELAVIEPYIMDDIIRFARLGVLCGMENRRVFGYIEFNSPTEILNKARNLGYIEIIPDTVF